MTNISKAPSLRDFVDKLNKDDEYRENFFKNPSSFLEQETGINVGSLREEVDSYVKKLKTSTPGAAKFYLPGELPEMPEEVAEWIREHEPCIF